MSEEATIEEVMPQGIYRVRCGDGSMVKASLDLSFKRIAGQIIPGCRVNLERYPLDPSRGKIVKVIR
jgi:translation initiation factor IF-1